MKHQQLDKKSTDSQRLVEVFTKFAHMRFVPQVTTSSEKSIQSFTQKVVKQQNTGVLTKVKTLLGLSPPKVQSHKHIKSPPKLKASSIQSSTSLTLLPHSNTLTQLQLMQNLQKISLSDKPISIKHLHKLTPDHFIIGNQQQLDIVNINCLVGDYIDSEVMCSIKGNGRINVMAVDTKRLVFVLVTQEKELVVYEYQLKRGNDKPQRILTIKIDQDGDREFSIRFAQFVRDSQLLLLSDTHLLLYSLEGNQLQHKSIYEYPLGKHHNLKLFQVPQPFENKLNIFFQQQLPGQKVFALWCLQADLLASGVKLHQLSKVYQVQTIYKSHLQLENYSKDVYLLNLGFQILAFKKGYLIDSVNVNIQSESSHMVYLGNRKLIHITKTHADVYRFDIQQSSPPKIEIKSVDSIVLPTISLNFDFFKVIEMLSSSLVIVYQLSPEASSLVGETRYKFGVTKKIPFQQKINIILPSQSQMVSLSSQLIQQKCSVIKKMGLSNRQVYLRIWNKSPKQRVQDFKFLLSTDHYETIKQEIQKKLRKSSMSYRELQTIQKVCCQMLSQKVFGVDFDMGQMKNFLISSFLIKKYELYFEFSKIDKKCKANKQQQLTQQQQNRQKTNNKSLQDSRQQPTKIMINVQNYHKFSKADIKATLLQYVSEYCIQQKPQYVDKIRVIFKKFKFCLRIDYLKLVEEMIRMSHNNLLVLLEAVPEILPFNPDYSETDMPEDPQLYSGVWGDITAQEWENNLHKQKIITVYNKELVEEAFQSDVWYKRNWNTLHGCAFLTRDEITQIHQKNKGQQIFYLVISQVYERIDSQERVRELLQYIETKYSQVPYHLCGKVWLYKSLYDYLMQKQFDPDLTLKQFLRLKDFELFKLIFKHQKTHKNLIFTQIKPIFHSIYSSDQVFNQSLLNYFNSQLSQISDVKYLLNRMNNKKREFHIQNQQTYQVLVKAIQSKIKLGSSNDTPIDQVLIYIQNIPLSSDNEIMKDLRVIEQIGEEAEKFQAMGLDMSLYEIINNPDSVISALVDYQIKQSKIISFISYQPIKNTTYHIIAQAQAIKQKIYQQQQADLTFFIYLTKLLQHQHMLPYAKSLLQDPILAQYYTIDEMMVQNLVLFMYKQRFAKDPVYVKSKKYIEGLVGLLTEGNLCKRFILSEIELAVYLSPTQEPLWYPITGPQTIITVFELQSYINNLPNHMLPQLDPKFIYQRAIVLQQIASDHQTSNIHLHSIYQFIILKLIQNFQLKQAIKKIKQCFAECEKKSQDYLYPAMILSKVFNEFCQQNRQYISLCNRYLFTDPKQMVQLLEDLMTHRYDSGEQKGIIMRVLEKAEKINHVFSERSILLQRSYTQLLTSKQSPANKPQLFASFDILLIQVQRQLIKLKDQFKTFDFHIIFALLSNDPYVLVKWVFLQRFQLNLKNFRCFLSYFIKEDLFDKVSVLEFGKRLFKMIYVSINEHRPIDEVIEEYKSIPIDEIMEIQRIKLLENEMDRKISKSLQRFKSKLKMVKSQPPKIKAQSLDSAHSKINKMVQQVKSPLSRLIEPFKYAFHDSDDDFENKESQIKRDQVNKAKKEERNIFDAKLQRTLLMSRRLTGKQTNLYLSSEKSIPPNMYFSQNFGIKGNMLNELIKSKKFPTLKKSKDQMTYARSGSPYQSGIFKNEDDHRQFFQTIPQKSQLQEKKPKRKFNIAKVQSQYVNLNDFLSFQKLVNSIDRDKQTTSKQSLVPSIEQIQFSRQLKMQTKTESSPGEHNKYNKLTPTTTNDPQGYLLAYRHFSKIRKISEEIQDFDGTEYPSQQSQVSKTVESQESVIDLEVVGEQQQEASDQNSENNNNTINEQLINNLLQQLLKLPVQQEKPTPNIQPHLQPLQHQRHKTSFPTTIKQLIDKLYTQPRPTTHLLHIIKTIADKYSESNINQQYVSVYIRMAQLHAKFSLKFPFRKVFVPAGLVLEKGSTAVLYVYLNPFLESYIDEENVLKVGKVLALGFQKSQIELEIHFILLKKYIKEIILLKEKILNTSYINQNRRRQDIDLYNGEIQKLQKYLEKVPANLFIQKDQQIFQLLKSFEKQNKTSKMQSSQVSDLSNFNGMKDFNNEVFVSIIYEALKKRGDQKIAEMLKSKWEKNYW